MELLQSEESISEEPKNALLGRIEFRMKFLRTVEMAESRKSPSTLKESWTDLLAASSRLKTSAHLGKPVPESFSVKVQRKLASTVPPRPIVEVSQKDAFTHLEQLCKDGSVAVEVLNFYDTQSLMVGYCRSP